MAEIIFSNSYNLVNCSYDERLHKFHTLYEQPIFDLLRTRYLQQLKSWWASYNLPIVSETDKCIVIYETRCHLNLEFLIYNLTYFARGWGLIIYCSKHNYNFIVNILQQNRYRAILHIVRDDEGTKLVREDYNHFTKSHTFWNSLPCKYVLMCEMDAYLRKKIPDDITDFDYVCCKWPWHPDLSGGGGISIRKVSTMKKICDEYPNISTNIFAQDIWAANGCALLNLKYNNVNFNNTYFIESCHDIIDPIGFHNWWTFINPYKFYKYRDIYDKYLTLEI